MSERNAFGPSLRRLRVQRGISLEQIAATTKVGVDLWAALERNDFSQWPTGIYARANVRAYAIAVGADPEATIEEFCRSFPTGDRRAERVVREHAAIVGHDLRWKDDLVGMVTDEKRARPPSQNVPDFPALAFAPVGRIVAATLDLLLITAAAAAGARLLPWGWAVSLAVSALAYNAVSLVALGCTPAVWTIETYILNRHPGANRLAIPRFLRLVRSSDRAKA